MCANTNKYVWEKQAMGRRVEGWTNFTPEELKKIPVLVAVYVGLQLLQNLKLLTKENYFTCGLPSDSDVQK